MGEAGGMSPGKNPGPQAMPRRLPVVRISGVEYFLDMRLKQLRRVDNPHDYIDLDSDEPADAD